MSTPATTQARVSKKERAWPKYLLLILCAEKIIQHVVVTLSFYSNFSDIRATVAVDYRVLMILGGIVAVLFALALWLIWRGNPLGAWLVIGLALFDIVGEFIAQGTLGININVSFVVAIVLLILGIIYARRGGQARTRGQVPDSG